MNLPLKKSLTKPTAQSISSEIDRRIEMLKALLDVPLNEHDPELVDQLTLGDHWDNPELVMRAFDSHPIFSARWQTYLRKTRLHLQATTQALEIFEGTCKETLATTLYEENVKKKMTPGQAKPSAGLIDRAYLLRVVNGSGKLHDKYQSLVSAVAVLQEKIDLLEVVVEAFKKRHDMLIQMGSLLRTLIENQMIAKTKITK